MKLILILALLPLALYSQQQQPVVSIQPDCGRFVQPPITTAGTFTFGPIDNRAPGCDGFVVSYSSNGFATVSVLLQSANLGVGGVAGAFATFAGTITAGYVNPATATTCSTGTSCEIRATGYFPYVNVQVTTTGTGYLVGEFHGFKTNPNAGSAGGGGCVGTVATPCVVVGPTAAGSPPTTSPVLVAGQDGTNIQTLKTGNGTNNLGATTTTQGVAQIMPMVADPTNAAGSVVQLSSVRGVAPTGGAAANALLTGLIIYNGSTFDFPFVCANQKLVTLADATLTALVTASGTTAVRVCSAHMTTSGAAETVSLIQGTGVACAGGAVTIDAFLNVTALVMDYAPTGALRTAASNGLCVQQSGVAQSADVWISYAQF